MLPFDPDFDDARWTLEWAKVPILQVPIGSHPDGYVVIERMLTRAQIFDRFYEAGEPFPVRALLDSAGKLWMSDTPQERMMMYNNAMASQGRILIGGLGLAMYPQYVVSRADHFTIVEQSRAVVEIVGPTLERALSRSDLTGLRDPSGLRPIPFEIIRGNVEAFLSAEPTTRYDTIFLDTWDTLTATNLPRINGWRDRAIRHLAPGGHVLLWGYRWMVRLFEDACRQLLSVPPDQREAWLAKFNQPEAAGMLQPVLERFEGQAVGDIEVALTWCREHIVSCSA
ncbi:MAG TPA: hypothetical protein VJ793_16180 [Anaerolineae bacterium]|nr:hypothetical protein [Anaerolineae bacterium]